MVMEENINLDIASLEKIKEYKLTIPDYQRPKKKKKSTADTLFNDIYSAMKENKEYRLGSLILHRDENGFYSCKNVEELYKVLHFFSW